MPSWAGGVTRSSDMSEPTAPSDQYLKSFGSASSFSPVVRSVAGAMGP
jgi:hypothetical protein